MDTMWLYYGGAAAVAVIAVYGTYLVKVEGNAWRAALTTIAQKHRLTHVMPKGAVSKKFDVVHGSDGGVDVSLVPESVSRGDSDTLYAKIEASGGPGGLFMVPPGKLAKDSGTIDYSNPGGSAKTPTGVADFDRDVEIRGAPEALLEELRKDPILRTSIAMLIKRGVQVRDRQVVAMSTFPRKAGIVVDRYDRVVELARKLETYA